MPLGTALIIVNALPSLARRAESHLMYLKRGVTSQYYESTEADCEGPSSPPSSGKTSDQESNHRVEIKHILC